MSRRERSIADASRALREHFPDRWEEILADLLQAPRPPSVDPDFGERLRALENAQAMTLQFDVTIPAGSWGMDEDLAEFLAPASSPTLLTQRGVIPFRFRVHESFVRIDPLRWAESMGLYLVFRMNAQEIARWEVAAFAVEPVRLDWEFSPQSSHSIALRTVAPRTEGEPLRAVLSLSGVRL